LGGPAQTLFVQFRKFILARRYHLSLQSSAVEQVLDMLMDIMSWESLPYVMLFVRAWEVEDRNTLMLQSFL